MDKLKAIYEETEVNLPKQTVQRDGKRKDNEDVRMEDENWWKF